MMREINAIRLSLESINDIRLQISNVFAQLEDRPSNSKLAEIGDKFKDFTTTL